MTHVVLLGDSIFDNGAYIGGAPDVVRQLRTHLNPDGQATLCAVDGHVTTSVPGQLRNVPAGATHRVVSVGGNDALRHMSVLDENTASVTTALERLAEISGEFRQNYVAMLAAVLGKGLPTALCTIYDPRFPNYRLQRLAVLALGLFNTVILREAAGRGLPVIDLRLVCDDDQDFANPIEPSAHGGDKIAATVARLVREHDFSRNRTEIYVRP
jgi:hypothetical protein